MREKARLTHRVTIRLDDSEMAYLRKYARIRNMSVSNYIRQALYIERMCDYEIEKELSKKVVGHA